MVMRIVFGVVACLFGILSVALTARYGAKGADTALDGALAACIYGAISLCAFLFDGLAVRLWFTRHRVGAVFIGFVATLALVVTITNSLGAIAGRADATQAERAAVLKARAEVDRLIGERAKLPAFAPADAAEVAAGEALVRSAERSRAAECDKRGPECRKREADEATARTALSAIHTRRALTDSAAEIDRQIDHERGKLDKAPPVGTPNPLGAALELIIGQGAAMLTAWQQAIVAVVFELCLVGLMVGYELLGQPASTKAPAKDAPRPTARQGAIEEFLCDHLESEPGEGVETFALYTAYKTWCQARGFIPMIARRFADDLPTICDAVGIQLEARNGSFYCVDMRLAA
jgi:hypothetical protein